MLVRLLLACGEELLSGLLEGKTELLFLLPEPVRVGGELGVMPLGILQGLFLCGDVRPQG